MPHIVLLGDSVFDNGAYVQGGPDVVKQLASIAPPGWQATLGARDGAVISDVKTQLDRIPADASHLVISAGGNDELRESSVLDEPARSVAEAIAKLAAARDRFRSDYAAMLDLIATRRLRTAICTIYEPRFPEPFRRRIAAAALTLLNDCITREAFSAAPHCPLPEFRCRRYGIPVLLGGAAPSAAFAVVLVLLLGWLR